MGLIRVKQGPSLSKSHGDVVVLGVFFGVSEEDFGSTFGLSMVRCKK